MRHALAEAYRSTRAVRPNPRVGCALETSQGELVCAHHEKRGEAHAEARVLKLCKERGFATRGARVAVTLEPCSHHGKTPPCADALIEAGVAEVFVGTEDPFPQVRGQGIERLRAAGISVTVGVLKDKAEALNSEWLFAHRQGRAHLTLKMATSWDGGWRSASGASRWITSEEAREKAQELRRRVDAIATGSRTVSEDNPHLTARWPDGSICPHQPQVFVLTRGPQALDLSAFKLAQHPGGARAWVLESPLDFLKSCYEMGLYDILLEAGPTLSQVFMDAGAVDEIWSFQESQFLGGNGVLRFPIPFSQGNLPGLRYEIRDLELLGNSSIFARLRPLSHVLPEQG